MSELALRQLGRELEWPPEPDLVPAVRERLGADVRQQRRSLRPLALAFAVLAVAVGVAMAVPPARSAILDFFGIGGVEIKRVETVPPAQQAPLPLGERVTLDQAQEAADFQVAVPDVRVESVYLDRVVPGGRISLVWHEGGRRLVLSQFEGEQLPYFQKQIGPRSKAVTLTFRGSPAVWITGPDHVVVFRDRNGMIHGDDVPHVAGNVLLWDAGRITYRLEGAPTRQRALQILATLGR